MAMIMVVDDSETQRFELAHSLKAAGHEVIEAQDGADGLKKLEQNSKLNLIICDVNMPIMGGIAMCMKIKESGKYNGLPIFMLTTEASIELKQSGKAAGVRAWITKPFVAEKLIDAISKVLTKKS